MTHLMKASMRAGLAAVLVLPLLAVPALADVVVHRAAGDDRIQTAVQASENFRRTASDAILTTAFSFPDALAAGALAHRLDAPLLLTERDRLPSQVADELTRLRVSTVWILGGERAVAPEVQEALRDLGVATRRLAGQSRYETAREIAQAAGPSRTGEVILALGEHADPDRAWPDAVASGALAATPDRIPTVLTRPDALPEATEEALAMLQATEVIILGGPEAVAPAVEERLSQLGYDTRRVAGNSRYATSVALAEEALERFDAETMPAVFASGDSYPDALSAGSLAASLGAPLMLVPPSADLPAVTESFLRGSDRLTSGVIVGGPAAADDYVLAQLDAALQNEPAPGGRTQPSPEPPSADAAIEENQPSSEEVYETFGGVASWYGPGLAGNQTANGETFDPRQLTAAHRTLPFNTIVRVTNLDNGNVVEVRINDRGPYAHNRVLDVSSAAADVLGMKHSGVANIRGELIR